MSDSLNRFLAGDITLWRGLDNESMDTQLRRLAGRVPVSLRGQLGSPPVACERLTLSSPFFGGGLFAWRRDGVVVVVEGCLPGRAGDVPLAPVLPQPEATYPFPLGSVWLEDAERVYPERGLAVRLNPGNGLLLGLVGFAPTTAERYRARLRPFHDAPRLLSVGDRS